MLRGVLSPPLSQNISILLMVALFSYPLSLQPPPLPLCFLSPDPLQNFLKDYPAVLIVKSMLFCVRCHDNLSAGSRALYLIFESLSAECFWNARVGFRPLLTKR